MSRNIIEQNNAFGWERWMISAFHLTMSCRRKRPDDVCFGPQKFPPIKMHFHTDFTCWADFATLKHRNQADMSRYCKHVNLRIFFTKLVGVPLAINLVLIWGIFWKPNAKLPHQWIDDTELIQICSGTISVQRMWTDYILREREKLQTQLLERVQSFFHNSMFCFVKIAMKFFSAC